MFHHSSNHNCVNIFLKITFGANENIFIPFIPLNKSLRTLKELSRPYTFVYGLFQNLLEGTSVSDTFFVIFYLPNLVNLVFAYRFEQIIYQFKREFSFFLFKVSELNNDLKKNI